MEFATTSVFLFLSCFVVGSLADFIFIFGLDELEVSAAEIMERKFAIGAEDFCFARNQVGRSGVSFCQVCVLVPRIKAVVRGT